MLMTAAGEDKGWAVAQRVMLFAIIMVGQVSQSIMFSVVSPLLPAMAHSFGTTQATLIAQLLFALPSLGLVIAGVMSGWLIDLAGLRRTLLWSGIFYGVMGSVPLVTASVPVLLLTRLLLGAACAILSTSCTMLLILTYAGEARSRAMGYQSSIGSAGGLVTLMLSGVMAGSLGWHASFSMYALVGIIVAVFVLRSMPARSAVGQSAALPGADEAPGGAFTVIKILWPVYLAGCLLFTYPMAAGSALPFVLQKHGLGAGLEESILLSSFTTFSAIGAFLFGRVQEHLGPRATFALGLLLSGIGMLIVGLCRSEILIFLGIGMAGLGLGFYIPHLWMVVTTAAPAQLRGRAAGLFNAAMYLGGFTSPFFIAILTRLFGTEGVFTALSVAAFVAFLAMLVTKKGILSGASELVPATEAG